MQLEGKEEEDLVPPNSPQCSGAPRISLSDSVFDEPTWRMAVSGRDVQSARGATDARNSGTTAQSIDKD